MRLEKTVVMRTRIFVHKRPQQQFQGDRKRERGIRQWLVRLDLDWRGIQPPCLLSSQPGDSSLSEDYGTGTFVTRRKEGRL